MPPNLEYREIAHKRAAEKKTHVSFPQLKYPSLRDGGVRDAYQWLQGKAMDDGAEGFWRVHDGLYDLNEFIKRHPGGEDWLELTKDTDITEAFETHHLNPIVWKVLEKFYVRQAKTPRNSPFTFKDDGFYRSLKRVVAEEVKKVPKNVTRHSDMILDGLLITLLISSPLSCWARNFWLVMVLYLTASVALGLVIIASHNYIHLQRKSNWRKYLFNVSLMAFREYKISHVLSHHLYTNTLMDFEISSFEPLVCMFPRRTVSAKYALLIEQAFLPFYMFVFFVRKLLVIVTRKNFFRQHCRWHDFIGLLLPLWMWFASGASLNQAIINWIWMCCTSSFMIANIGIAAAHYHPTIFTDGDQVRDVNLDWGVHEVKCVMDRTDISGNLFKVLTFFGDHGLHHLFPTLDHAVLQYLYPVFLQQCQKFKVDFRMTSSFDLFIGQIQQVMKTEPNLLKE